MADARERHGLTAPEVADRLRRDGPNVRPATRPASPVLLLARQMTHFFALLLLLTRNEMAVVRAWTPACAARISGTGYSPAGAATASPAAVPHLRCLAIAAVRSSTGRNIERPDGWHPVGDPMEAALSTFAMRAGVSLDELSSSQVERQFPFEPRRRRASVVADGLLQVKGAPDAVLPRCLPVPGRTLRWPR